MKISISEKAWLFLENQDLYSFDERQIIRKAIIKECNENIARLTKKGLNDFLNNE